MSLDKFVFIVVKYPYRTVISNLPKMSNKVTQKRSYINLLENSLHDLFAPSSPRSLIDYNELKLIDTRQLALVKRKDLALVDFKQLALLDIAVLTFFIQYVGALTMTLVFGLLLGAGMFGVQGAVSKVDGEAVAHLTKNLTSNVTSQISRVSEVHALAFDSFDNSVSIKNSSDPVVVNRYTRDSYQKNITNSDGRKSLHTYNLESPTYTDQRPLGSFEYSAVAGASTEREINSNTACSFNVNGSSYSDGSVYRPANESVEVCAYTSKGQVNWQVDDDALQEVSSGCIALNDNVSAVTASVNDDFGESVGSCSLSFLAAN